MPVDASWSPAEFAAQMTARQFLALRERLDHAELLNEVGACTRFRAPKRGKNADPRVARRWMINGWNTEVVLGLSEPLIAEGGGASLQWVFPQAYYALFASTLSFFQSAGFTESSHSSVQGKFGELVTKGDLPASLSFALGGTSRHPMPYGLAPAEEPSPIHFQPGKRESVDRKILQFLSSTREFDLKSKRTDLRGQLLTKRGKPAKRLTEAHWAYIAGRVPPTNLLNLLYRKRIKANYREMDAFLECDMDPTYLYEAIVRVVRCACFANECLTARALGASWYQRAVAAYSQTSKRVFLEERSTVVLGLLDRAP